MECKTIQTLLPFRDLPGELGPEERADLEKHLAQCPKCAAAAQAEHSFDDRVGQAIQNVTVPAGLRDQLLGPTERGISPLRV